VDGDEIGRGKCFDYVEGLSGYSRVRDTERRIDIEVGIVEDISLFLFSYETYEET
jgi:hypothetical protein